MNYLDTYIAEKHVPEDFQKELRSLNKEDLSVISKFLEVLSPSNNSFQVLYKYMIEISARDKKSISEILSDEELRKIVDGDKGSRKEKLSLVRRYLELKRFPEKNKIQDLMGLTVSNIRKEYGVILDLPDELEGDTVHVQFSIKSAEDFGNKLRKLEELRDSNQLEHLFDILMGRI